MNYYSDNIISIIKSKEDNENQQIFRIFKNRQSTNGTGFVELVSYKGKMIPKDEYNSIIQQEEITKAIDNSIKHKKIKV